MLKIIKGYLLEFIKKNYEIVTKDYQRVLSDVQHEVLNKNNNLKKLKLIK